MKDRPGERPSAVRPSVERPSPERPSGALAEAARRRGEGTAPPPARAPEPGPRFPRGHRVSAIRISLRTAAVLALASVAGLAMFFWPLFAPPQPEAMAHSADAPLIFIVAMPVILAVVLAELSSGGIDTKALALLGVLCAINAGLRPLGAGTAGIETVFFLLVLAGRVFGPGFGFALGSLSLFASALLTAGVGPWLPFQMIASAWIGLGAGLLPRRVTGRAEIAMLAVYGVVAAYLFGFIMNMWFWPFTAGIDTQLSFDPDASVPQNLHTFLIFTLATSTFGWDTGRALTNLAAILLVGPAVLAALRRAARRAAFDAPVSFGPAVAPTAAPGFAGTPAAAAAPTPATPGPVRRIGHLRRLGRLRLRAPSEAPRPAIQQRAPAELHTRTELHTPAEQPPREQPASAGRTQASAGRGDPPLPPPASEKETG